MKIFSNNNFKNEFMFILQGTENLFFGFKLITESMNNSIIIGKCIMELLIKEFY